MSWIKVIGLNIFITFGLLGILLLAPPIFYQSYSFMAGESEGRGSADKRHELSLYSDIPWAEQHFVEFSKLSQRTMILLRGGGMTLLEKP